MSGRSAERGARPGSSPAAARARGRYAFIRAESADRRTRLIQITVYTHVDLSPGCRAVELSRLPVEPLSRPLSRPCLSSLVEPVEFLSSPVKPRRG
jgi:hypothetical protein